MTPGEFRALALSLPGAFESAHMNHPDFRAKGKIFATLGYPDDDWGMVKLTPEQQKLVVKKEPGVFRPCKGAWGLRGATNIHLPSAKRAVAQSVLKNAWDNLNEDAAVVRRTKSRKGAEIKGQRA